MCFLFFTCRAPVIKNLLLQVRQRCRDILRGSPQPFFEIAFMLVCLYHVASVIINADDSVM